MRLYFVIEESFGASVPIVSAVLFALPIERVMRQKNGFVLFETLSVDVLFRAELVRHFVELLDSAWTHVTVVAVHCHTIDGDEPNAIDSEMLHVFQVEGPREPTLKERCHLVVEAYVVVSVYCDVHRVCFAAVECVFASGINLDWNEEKLASNSAGSHLANI